MHSRPVYLVATLAHLRETGYFVTHVTSVFQRVRSLLSSFDARHTRIIEHMHLAACVPCQYDCVDCAHDGMRNKFSGYHLNLDDLREFIRCTEESRYLVKLLDLTGPGEPLLWRNLKEGLRLLHKSPAIRKVRIVTNGLALNRLDDEDWGNIDHLEFSWYPANQSAQDDLAALGVHRAKVHIRNKQRFKTAPVKGDIAPVPCACECSGPMYFDRKIFFYCGPPVFGAAENKGVEVSDFPEMYGDIGPDYLRRSESVRARWLQHSPWLRRRLPILEPVKRIAAHELCKHCFANGNREYVRNDHIPYVNAKRPANQARA